MELAVGRFSASAIPWGGGGELRALLQQQFLPTRLWLSASGPELVMQRGFKPMELQGELAGLKCAVFD